MQVLLTILLIPLFQVIVAAIMTLPIWLLWNWIAVDVFSLPSITVPQSFGLVLLVGLLLGYKKITIER